MAKTAYRKPKKKVHVFDIVNYIVFILIGLLVLVPIWKVVVDSFNAVGVYQFRLWPEDFTLDGYKTIIHTQRLYRPFINSVITTVLGTFLGLLLSTLGGYVPVSYTHLDVYKRQVYWVVAKWSTALVSKTSCESTLRFES